jgi:hypothetical protein
MFGKSVSVFSSTLVAMAAMVGSVDVQASGLIHDRNFESGTLQGWRGVGTPVRPIYSVENKIVRGGKYSAKAFLDSSASVSTDRERVEMRVLSDAGKTDADQIGSEYWYGWSMYLKSPWPVDPLHWELLSQFHCNPDKEDEHPNPALSITIKPGSNRFTISSKSDSNKVSTLATVSSRSWDGGPVSTDGWIDWVVNVKWSHSSDGFLKVWRDGKLMVEYKGPNLYNDELGPYFKMGIYKANWVRAAPHPSVKTRLAYFDEYKKAGANGSYDMVAPAGKKVAAPQPPSLVSVE